MTLKTEPVYWIACKQQPGPPTGYLGRQAERGGERKRRSSQEASAPGAPHRDPSSLCAGRCLGGAGSRDGSAAKLQLGLRMALGASCY